MIVRVGRKREGFTLIELMVVVGILAILVALSAAAIMRVQNAQQNRSSQDVVEKVQTALNNQYKAIIDQARNDIGNGRALTQDAQAMVNYAEANGGDADTALALLTYARIRWNFPQTFAEVQPFTVAGFKYAPKSNFAAFAGAAGPANVQDAWKQSALLLYAATADTGAGGSVFASEATNMAKKSFTVDGVTATAYMDAWQNPIGFCRFGTNAELQNTTPSKQMPTVYANNKNKQIINSNGKSNTVTITDPLDSGGKLYQLSLNNPNGAAAIASVVFLNDGDAANATSFNGVIRVPVVYSVGKNGIYESLGNSPSNGGQAAQIENDDILGYRLTQIGFKGTQ
jgi:prepilin-type N-terminal cleavage/methylation domain-containing protein